MVRSFIYEKYLICLVGHPRINAYRRLKCEVWTALQNGERCRQEDEKHPDASCRTV